jgi:predicted AAA+ superfamily ATPase
MIPISENDIKARIERDNPWWINADYIIPEAAHPRRVYFTPFKTLALNFSVKRAALLLGPRRVGKTFMIRQLIHEAIKEGVKPTAVLYASTDTPVFSGMSLEKFLQFMPQAETGERQLVIFDEIQYLKNWEVHLKDLVDNYPAIKFVATGSAAAALRLKSLESGAGRFSNFMLPPLTFCEFLRFLNEDTRLIQKREGRWYSTSDIESLNTYFLDYLTFGGFPEAVLNEQIRKNPEQFIKNDIVDKVLLKDLPSLYGIHDTQQLNKLFAMLAYNSGNEVSMENICQNSGIPKPTIKRYIEYLESSFLILKLSRIDETARALQREHNFKIYLNNPSMRAALFAPVGAENPGMIGHLAESAVFAQWQHSSEFRNLRYARWRIGREGELDAVYLGGPEQKPLWVGEVKWSDRAAPKGMKTMKSFLAKHPTIRSGFLTTKTITAERQIEGRTVRLMPTALYCYTIGRNIGDRLEEQGGLV